MAKKITDEVVEQILKLYEETHDKKEVAGRLNVSVATVNKYLNLNNVEAINHAKCKILTQEEIDKINELYQQYANLAEVSRQTGFSTALISKNLTEENRNLKEKMQQDKDALWYYIFRLFGQADEKHPVSQWNVTQINKFKSQGISYKAQLLTLKYFYEVKKNSTKKSNGSIGIIPYVFTEAKMYYDSIIDQQEKINRAIQEQLEKDRIEIKYKPFEDVKQKRKKKQIDLSKIGDDSNDNT